ncbi:MAG: prephenate dehydrogenase [Desulfovibrionales bacterium]|jgi:prephenate dehydrogenase|nr:prephenate dehydrogenase [Desulfovibrionales bacterium]
MIERVAVIGARGQMGGLIMDRCRLAGVESRGLDRPLTGDALRRAFDGADLAVVSVPLWSMEEVLRMTAPLLDQKTILADVCSVKVHPLQQMLAVYGGPVVGTHPLFGPVIPEGFEPRVAVTPGRVDQAAGLVSDFFKALGFFPFMTTAEEHDEAVAKIQGLNFSTTVAYLACLARTPGVDRFLTPSFERRLEAARKMLTMDKDLFVALSEANPYSQDAVRHFGEYLDIAAGGDLDLLAEMAGWWWRTDDRGSA